MPWQLAQLVLPTGMWVAPLPVAPLPLWQLVQLVAALKLAWSTLAPLQLALDLWQLSHTVCPACTLVLGLTAVWQVAHCVVTLALLCTLAGGQLLKPARWQLSQARLAVAATCVNGV